MPTIAMQAARRRSIEANLFPAAGEAAHLGGCRRSQPHCLILFECKFREHDGGTCSQTHPILTSRHKGLVQCSGHYLEQVNPANGREARCALSAKGIEYWDHIPDVFGYDASINYAPCPFARSWFQWMRNLTTCRAVTQRHGLRPAFVMVYADGPGLPMAGRIGQPEWAWLRSRVDPAAVEFQALSFQTVVDIARQASPANPVWPELAAWVQRKIDSACGPRERHGQASRS